MNSLKKLHLTITLISMLILSGITTIGYAAGESSGCRVNLVHSNEFSLEMTVELTNLDITPIDFPGIEQNYLSIEGESQVCQPGYPDLPSISRMFVVPPTKAIVLEWDHSGSRQLSVGEVTSIPYEDNPVAATNEKYSTRTALYPEQVVSMGKPAIMRGVRILPITINPIQIDPVSGELTVWDRITVRLSFSDVDPINPVVSSRPYSSVAVDQMIRSLVVNPEDIQRFSPQRDDPQHNDASKGGYLYVIPDYTDENEGSVLEAIQPLAKWRRQQGYNVDVTVIESDWNNVQVKNIIRDYYESENPPEVVCLVGEADLGHLQPMIPTWDVGRAYMWETDYKYVLLEGDDMLPEAAIGRISCRSVRELKRIIETKMLAYEVTPHMEDENGEPDTEWFLHAALMANDELTGYSSLYLQRWAAFLLEEVGFTEVDTMYFTNGRNQDAEHNFIADNINETGISLFNYRGWGEFSGAWGVDDVRELENGSKLPLLILPTCNTADFADHIQNQWSYAEDFLWGTSGGAIGVVGSSGFTHTNYNNVFNGGMLNSIYRDKNWRAGWAVNRGKIEMWRHFGLFGDVEDPQVPALLVWEAIAFQLNYIGDPGTEIWTDVPQLIEVDVSEQIAVGNNYLSAIVTDVETGDPVESVTVTLLLDDELIRVAMSDMEGRVQFTFDQGELEAETMLELTATAHNVKPYMTDIGVVAENQHIGVLSYIVDDDMAGQSRGNRDNMPNPGETIELRTFFGNFGDESVQGEVTASLECLAGGVEVVRGEVDVDAPAMGDSALATFIVRVTPETCYNTQRLLFHLTITDGELQYGSVIELNVGAPDLEYVSHQFTPEVFRIGEEVYVDVTLRNSGVIAGTNSSLTLVSGREVVNVYNDDADIGPLGIDGDEVTARFRIHAHDLTVPGTDVSMMIYLESTEGLMTGFLDTTSFQFRVDTPESNTPFGPDSYGYVCFDDTDEDWAEVAPVYEWVEIDPALDDEDRGVDTEIRDLGNEQDWSVLMDLPFPFQYYGQDFDDISICSNGWFAFGNQALLADFQNRRIPPALGPRAQVCVFWDDLINYVEGEERIGGVFTWYDEENDRFIIEWSQMRRFIGMNGNEIREGSVNTFQAILYDPQVYSTYTGDGEIVFQYHTVNNDAVVDPAEYDTPYATVGIVNLNGTDGMEYTYWNEYPAGAAELEDGRAIKFSTKLIVVVGAAEGTVTDLATGNPIPDVEIRGSRGSFALTDDEGRFEMENVLIGEDYSFTAWAPGYNEQTLDGFNIEEGSTVSMDFSLQHPEFNLTSNVLDFGLMPDEENVEIELMLSNDGNGPLQFRSFFDYPQGEDNERWRRLLDVNVSEATEDFYIYGANDFAGNIWITGSFNRRNPQYYLFSHEGTLIRVIDQPVESRYGMFGTVVDPVRELLYGTDEDWIIGVNAQGEAVDSIPKPDGNRARALAYDPVSEHFWMAEGRNQIIEFDHEGEIVASYNNTLDIYGLAYFGDDPDGYKLYILSQDKTNLALQVPEALVSKFDFETEQTQVVTVLEGDVEDRAGGMNIVNSFDSHKWVMIAILTNADGDRVSVYDLGPNTTWVSYAPQFGEVEPEQSIPFNFVFNGIGLEEGDYTLSVHYIHNASGLEEYIPITMNVDSANAVTDDKLLPLQFGIGQNYPNPFNPSTGIPFTLPQETHAKLTVFDITGREIAVLVNEKLLSGHHSVVFNAGALPSGIYLIKLETPHQSAFIKTALLK